MTQKRPSSIKVISIQVTPAKPESVKKEINNIVNHVKYIFTVEFLIGINRLYLENSRRVFYWLGICFSALLTLVTIYFIAERNPKESASYLVVKDTNSIEYILLMIFPVLMSRGNLKKFFNDLRAFDHALNISDELHLTSPTFRLWCWLAMSILYSAGELILVIVHAPKFLNLSAMWSQVALFAHDCELLFFCTLLRMIMIRSFILKAYVVKTFTTSFSDSDKKLTEIEMLSNKAQLDISSLHGNYELLHKCAELLNSVMNLPMTLMLFCSGLSTTMLLKRLFKELQDSDEDDVYETRTVIIHCISRCLKYTVLAIIPCYISSVTTTQVSHIRTILHDAMNGLQTSKVERRRIKAFFQLTRENEFAYALWGVIRLNMTLPLSYLSLCTTYLVIIIQFSRFID